MVTTSSADRVMVVGSRLTDAETMIPVARTMSLAIPLEKEGPLVSLTPGISASFLGSAHRVTFRLLNTPPAPV